MKHLAHALTVLCQKHRIRGVDLHRKTGIATSIISRLMNARQDGIENANFDRICDALCRTDLERAQLVRARMLSLCYGRGADLIKVSVNGAPEPDAPAKLDPQLDPVTRDALLFLGRTAAKNRILADNLVGTARMMGFGMEGDGPGKVTAPAPKSARTRRPKSRSA